MSENVNVSEMAGERWGRVSKKRLSVDHAENGFIVDYKTVAENPGPHEPKTVTRQRVFLDPGTLLDFIASYFGGRVNA